MSGRRISRTLVASDGKIMCVACGKAVGAEGKPWKVNASLVLVPVQSMPGAPLAPHSQVVLRKFSCPACGALLDTETAMPEDPFLDDVLDVLPEGEGDDSGA